YRTQQSVALARALRSQFGVEGIAYANRIIRRLETERAHVWGEMLAIQRALETHIKTLNGRAPEFFENVARMLFDSWQPEHYAASMDAHTQAAVKVILRAGEDIVPSYVRSVNELTVVDVSCGDGGVTDEFVRRVIGLFPGLRIKLILNDISESMVQAAEAKVSPVLEGHGAVVKKNVNIVAKDASALITLGGPGTADVVLLLTSSMVELLFRLFFHETPYVRTVQEIRDLKTTHPFVIMANQLADIDGRHNMFLVVAQKP
ncbi:class I SAM-dependent methyltransferase, partial [Candidatus Micrarchaeota archaeon]|nr:class I SAM-dependent methyltransferase [Candidatus Micrarchaeota archaeon]